MKLLDSIADRLPAFRQLREDIDKSRLPAAVTGLSTIHKAHFIASLCSETGRKAIVVAADELEAGRLLSDLNAMGLESFIFPARDLDFFPLEGRSHDYEQSRVEALSRMLTGEYGAVVLCPAAAMQLTLPPEQLAARVVTLSAGTQVTMEQCVRSLVCAGYERTDQVDGAGQFAVRGGLLDVYPPDFPAPVRAEFWGDEIDSINYFDIDSQRRTDYVESIKILPAVELAVTDTAELARSISDIAMSLRGKANERAKALLFSEAEALECGRRPASADKFLPILCEREATIMDYLPDDGLFFVSEHFTVHEHARENEKSSTEEVKNLIEQGTLCKPLSRFTVTASELFEWFETRTVFLDTFTRGTYEVPLKDLIGCNVQQNSAWSGSTQVLKEDLHNLLSRGYSVCVMAGTQKSCMSLASSLSEGEDRVDAFYANAPDSFAPGKVMLTDGAFSAGFEYPEALCSVITWGRSGSGGDNQKKYKKTRFKRGLAIQDLSELSVGDYIVHTTYGIGVFEGVQSRTHDGVTKASMKIRYAGGENMYIPITQLDMVSKYIGAGENGTVKITKLGNGEWQRQKARVKKAVKDIAAQLTKLYAERKNAQGFAFPADGEWQRDFEARFEFDETDDQLRSAAEIKNDMESVAPMDRLLCGDVGFGKTEVAMRAAFKCVVAGKQCAILAPTTILAWQHYQTAMRRFDGVPVNVELLSRYRTAKEQTKILEKLKRGEIDILIGTHRIVQKDIEFRDLGLAIIDEEQRFGVAQKERFKEIFRGVDMLTLSATPIPRTLNMALGGLRDISVLEEAPQDRHPVQTYVMEYDEGLIAEAIRRELRRGGQVFYLHNKVSNIDAVAMRIQELVPEAVIAVAHGQMPEGEMSKVWKRLVDHEANVLVCTTIIETGVDVPNCNTLIIENADCFGLSQLHQIRGRVGRSTRRAYAYMTFKRDKELTEIAAKRLEAIREFTEFGSGMKIALRDLELRGAGNLLGGEQSGHMENVGYDMYMKLLNEAVCEEKGEKPAQSEPECRVDIELDAFIPDDYIENMPTRLSVYRLIASIRNKNDRSEVIDELIDRFGDVPDVVLGLCDIALLRSRASAAGVTDIRQNGRNFIFTLSRADLNTVSAFAARLRGRVLFTPGAKPHLNIRGDEKLPAMTNINFMLDTLIECGENNS